MLNLDFSDGDKTVRATGVASDGELWVSKVLHGIVALEKDTKHVVRLGLGDEEVQEEAVLRDQTLEVVERLKNVSAVSTSLLHRSRVHCISGSQGLAGPKRVSGRSRIAPRRNFALSLYE